MSFRRQRLGRPAADSGSARSRVPRRRAAFAAVGLALAAALVLGVGRSAATGPSGSYNNVVFSDGFESGNLSSWNGLVGNGTASVTAGAAHAGSYGLSLTNASGQFQALVKTLPSPLADSSVSFWVRIASGSGYQTVAQARDGSSSAYMWQLAYDGSAQAFHFYPYSGSGSTDVYTGANSAPSGTWLHVEIQYTATGTGGAQISINGATQPSWGVSGDYTRSANLQVLQLWNDGSNETDFDQVVVATPGGASVPSAPSLVSGVAGDGSVALSWAAPATNGGSPITGYRITPSIGGVAQTPILTGSTATSYTVTGLADGTAYTFTVAAINGIGTSLDSPASSPITPKPGYTKTLFSDGFESGDLTAWNGLLGTGTANLTAGAAHSGNLGLELTNASGQFLVLQKMLDSAVADSEVSFWVRLASGGTGLQTVAQARDASNGVHMWDLSYDNTQHAFIFFPYSGSGSTEISTGANSAAANTWIDVTVDYTATATGGAQLYLNGNTQTGWGVSGNYTRSANLQHLQLWNDGTNAVAFDQVSIATTPGAAVPPGAPTAVTGTAGNGSVALNWSAPASDGGSPITGYRVTPYVGGVPQTPISTGSTATSYNVTGLVNGTTYTFTVAAINALGAGADSAPSAGITPIVAQTVPGSPTSVVGVAGDKSVALSWNAPTSNGGSSITSYRITPYIGSTAQTAINTGSSSTSYTVTGLANGTAYSFTVAATNGVGTGADSVASAAVSPHVGYTNVIFGDGFESGSLSAWGGAPGTGSATVIGGSARTGSYGLRTTNTSGQYTYLYKSLPSPLADSATSLWVRLDSGSGIETLAQARDAGSGLMMWELAYDWNRNGFLFYPYSGSGSTEIFTGTGSASPGAWIQLEVHYTATSSGGAQLYVNGQTKPAWGVSGDYTRSANLQVVQLWNDAVGTTDFDDVRVATQPPAGATLPGAPSAVSGASRDGAVTLSWTPPSSDGGSAISEYQITPYVGGFAQTPVRTSYPVTSYTIGGLTNGTSYTFAVAAVNGVGIGASSALSPSVTPHPATLPGSPTGVVAGPKDGAVSLTWTAPSSDGGTPLTGYRITPWIGGTAQTPTIVGATTTSATISGLTNGTAYAFTVAAMNTIGTGVDSVASATVTPVPALSQYTNLVFSDGFESGSLAQWDGARGNGSVGVAAVDAHTGGYGLGIAADESNYQYIFKSLPSPLADSDTTFWFRAPADNVVSTIAQARDGSSSAMMWQLDYDANHTGFVFYPFSGSGSKEIFTGNGTVPANTWVKVSIQYTATAAGGAQIFINGQTQPGWGVSGDYTRTANLQTLQLWDNGLPTAYFDDVTVATLPPAGATPPAPPTGVTGGPLDSAVALSWNAPSSDGGSPITNYQITPYIGSTAQTPILTGSSATSFTVSGLTNGTGYTFTVAALNAAGAGQPSAASAPVTPAPAPPPGPPTAVTGSPGNGSVALSWSAPSSDGGDPIVNYRITPYVGGTAQTPIVTGSTSTSYTVTGLTNGASYTFTVAAANSSGYGAESAASAPVTPEPPVAPGAPTGVTGAPRDSAVALTWTAPSSDGGSPITSYKITPYIGSTAQTPVNTGSSATGFTVTGLTNGTSYTFTVAATNAVGTSPGSAASAAVTPAIPPANPIQLENQQPGTTSWQLDPDHTAQNHEIEGYASAASVNKGSSINFMVSLSSSAQYTMDIYRMGWYPNGTNPDGSACSPSCGGRLMLHVGPLNGFKQANCPTDITQNDQNFGMTECQWTPSYTLNVPATWTTGSYIVKLTRLDGQKLQSYMTFVVRDDSSTAKIAYSLDVTTWQAYNFWGGAGNSDVGYDLYSRFNDVTYDSTGPRAYTVSFDRPYLDEGEVDGAGEFFNWDFPMIRWMESKGYDMTYIADTDLESNPHLLAAHKVFVNVGHDEYYSDNMRAAITNGIAAGTNMAFFSANNFYFRITWAPDGAGNPLREQHADKNALPGSTTYQWRNLTPAEPENEIGGVMLEGVANDRPYLVANANSWIYSGTGLHAYTGNGTTGVVLSGSGQNALRGIVGYEFDARASTTPDLSSYSQYEPAGVQTLGHSFVPASDGNAANTWSDATVYTAPSGAMVFSAGTIQWSWGVDNGYNTGFCNCNPGYASAAGQKITENILDRFSGS